MGVPDTSGRWQQTLAYVESLPSAEDSYSGCTTKASVARLFASHVPGDSDLGELPTWLRELFSRPPLPSAWIPTVHANAVEMMAIDALGEPGFFRMAQEANRDFLRSPVYRAAVRVLSPAMLIRGAAFRWKHFHRGSVLRAQHPEPTRALIRLSYPDGLFHPLIAREKGQAFLAATELSGAEEVRCEVVENKPDHTSYEITWRAS